LAACNIYGALPVGTTAPYPNPYTIKISRAFFRSPLKNNKLLNPANGRTISNALSRQAQRG
jgi:hypothetical protein